MGADIYLNSVFKPHRAKHQAAFYAAVAARDAYKSEHPNAKCSFFGDLPAPEDADPQYQKLQDEVARLFGEMNAKGYFRDSYNSSSLFWVLGLSWWKDVGDVLNKRHTLAVTKMKKLRATILERWDALPHPFTPETVKGNKHLAELLQGDEPLEAWEKYFADKKDRLVALIDQAIELKEPLYCSV